MNKNIKISDETHKILKICSAETGMKISTIADEAIKYALSTKKKQFITILSIDKNLLKKVYQNLD